jgi:hypothetical protein
MAAPKAESQFPHPREEESNMRVLLILGLVLNAASCKQRQPQEFGLLATDEGSVLRNRFGGNLVLPVTPDVETKLPPSVFGFRPPIGRTPGVIIGVVPNGGDNSYNKPAIDELKASLKGVFFARASRGQPTFFTVAAVNLQRFSWLTKKVARRLLDSTARTEMADGYKKDVPPHLRTRFPANSLEQSVLIVDDDLNLHQQTSPGAETEYFIEFGLPVSENATPTDPVPVVLVTQSGLFRIGPYHLPHDKQQIVQALEFLLSTEIQPIAQQKSPK